MARVKMTKEESTKVAIASLLACFGTIGGIVSLIFFCSDLNVIALLGFMASVGCVTWAIIEASRVQKELDYRKYHVEGVLTEGVPSAPACSSPRLCCPRCRGTNIQFQAVTESKKTGCGTVLLYVILALTVFGLLIVIPLMLRKKTYTVTYAVCQNCGNRWKTK